jgi:hypothetical protein
MLGDEADFSCGRTPCIDDKMGLDQGLGGQRPHERAAGFILSHDPEENAARAERRNIARNVAGPADRELVAFHCENRSRCLGRNAGYFAVDEVVEH